MEIAARTVDEIIEALGGDVKAGEFFEITRQAVAKWRKKQRFPNSRLLHLKAARPDFFEVRIPELFESLVPAEAEKSL